MGQAFAPANIALVKYWGKRDEQLNLPATNSLSISLADLGANTKVELLANGRADQVSLNNQPVKPSTSFYQRIVKFLDLFREKSFRQFYQVDTKINLPVAAGCASSAAGFAALTLALNDLHNWGLSKQRLSSLARLGSGSACRSIEHGFVEWQAGIEQDGSDSYAYRLDYAWPELSLGLLIVNDNPKKISSRRAMRATKQTSPSYAGWLERSAADLKLIKQAIVEQDFSLLGQTAEANAIAMHTTIQAAQPSIVYSLPQTKQLINQIWDCRQQGVEVYFTQDAGANLKLLFLQQDIDAISKFFPAVKIICPFDK